MRVSEIMIGSVTTVRPDEAVDRARELMESGEIRHLPVVDEGFQIVGMVSDRDLLRARASRPPPAVVSQIMVRRVQTIGPEAPAADAVQLMLDFKVEAVPVVAQGTLVGIVTSTDFLSVICKLLRRIS